MKMFFSWLKNNEMQRVLLLKSEENNFTCAYKVFSIPV